MPSPDNDFHRPLLPLLLLVLLLTTACGHEALPPQYALPPFPRHEALTDNAAGEADTPADDEAAPADEAPAVPPEPEQTVDIEVHKLEKLPHWDQQPEAAPEKATDEKKYDFPVVITPQVEFYLDFFQHKQRKTFGRWLARSGRYLPMIRQELAAAGLPLDLAYLPLIESGYTDTAYSRARAVGLWQFIRPTALHFGLKIDRYVDERRDPEKATRAAVRYLDTLYRQFGSWHLAVAAYNAGEGKIQKAIRRYHTRDFWKIAEKRYLRMETKLYVPKLIAAIIIAHDPGKYGFADITYQRPVAVDTVTVPRWTPLQAVATALKIKTRRLRALNPELRRNVTPGTDYHLKVPAGSAATVAERLPRVHGIATTRFKTHVVRRGDTIGKICRRYRINKTTLLKANNLKSSRLRPGRRLRIPYQSTRYVLLSKKEYKNRRRLAKKDGSLILHTIRKGESLSTIAHHYGVSPRQIARWNGLADLNHIRAGQQLALYIGPPVLAASGHAAESPVPVLAAAGYKRKPGHQARARRTYYRVRGGDSLWRIARRFNVKTRDIKRWNNLKDNTIHPGLKLVVKVEI